MDSQKVYLDVVKAVALVVFKIPPNPRSAFKPELVPSEAIPDGLGADEPAWLGIIKEIEAELRGMEKEYEELVLGPVDARKTLNKKIQFTCGYIRDEVMALQAVIDALASLPGNGDGGAP